VIRRSASTFWISPGRSERGWFLRRHIWIGLAVSVLFLFLAVHKTDISELGQTLRTAQYAYLIPAVGLTLVSFWVRTVRWKYLLEPVKSISINSLFPAVMIGFMANNVLPAKLGEFIRAYSIGKKEGISKSSSFATIVVERVFDGFTLFLFLVIPLLIRPSDGMIRQAAYAAFVVYAGTLAFLILLKYRTDTTLEWTRRVLRPLPHRWTAKVCGVLRAFVAGLQVFHNAGTLTVTIALSVGMWLCMVGAVYVLLVSCDLCMPAYAAFLLLGAIALGFSVPGSPGSVGPVEFFSVAGLALFGIPKGQAVGFSIIFHASQYVPVTLIGLVYLWSEHLSFRAIREAE